MLKRAILAATQESWQAMRRLNYSIYDRLAEMREPFPDLPVFGVESFGQNAEDIIVMALLDSYATRRGVSLEGERFLEIGGNHPISTSATYLLSQARRMHGVIVEANPRLIEALARVRPGDVVLNFAVQSEDRGSALLSVSNCNELSSIDRDFVLNWDEGRVGERELIEVPATRIGDIMEQYFQDRPPVFLSIDIEGLDLQVLQDLDLDTWRPSLVQAEPSDHHIPENSLEIQRYMEENEYLLIAKTSVNLIFHDRRAF